MEGSLSAAALSEVPIWTGAQAQHHRLTCHVKWIEEYMPPLLSVDQKQKRIKLIIDNTLEWFEASEKLVASPCIRSHRLILASLYAHIHDFKKALEWIESAVEFVQTLTTEREQHVQAYNYLIQANFHLIKLMMAKDANANVLDIEVPPAVLESVATFYDENKAFQSVIVIAKGYVAKQMRLQETQIDLFRKAVVLDPLHADWHRILYKALRLQRRESMPGRTPSNEEKEAIETAFRLDPNCCLIQTCYAGMLDEKYAGHRDLLTDERKEELAAEIIDLMSKSLEENPNDTWTHTRIAEIYAYGFYPNLDTKQGLIMFKKCEERWPNSSMVLHKFGKYFALNNQLVNAFEYYTRALKDLDNFPCLMDYLKCGQKLNVGHDVMLEMLDKCLTSKVFNNVPFMRMMLAKGLLLWLMADGSDEEDTKKAEACDVWVEAAMKAPKNRSYMVKIITTGYWDIIGNYNVDIPELVSNLEVLLESFNGVGIFRDAGGTEKKKRVIKELINDFKGQGFRRSEPFPPPTSTYPQRNRSNSVSSGTSTRSSTSTSSWTTARSTLSQESFADSESNWRAGGSGSPPSRGGVGIFAGYEPHPANRFDSYLHLGAGDYLPRYSHSVPTTRPRQVPVQGSRSKADFDDNWRR